MWLPILLGLKNGDFIEEKKRKLQKITWDHKYENKNFLELVSLKLTIYNVIIKRKTGRKTPSLLWGTGDPGT